MEKPDTAKSAHGRCREGYVVTQRGRSGGFSLARPAKDKRIGDLMRLTEGDLDIFECFDPESNPCPLIGICRSPEASQEAKHPIIAALDTLTISEIATLKGALEARIDAAPARPRVVPA